MIARVKASGYWAVEVQRPGHYRFTLRERPAVAKYALRPGAARLQIARQVLTKPIPQGATGVTFDVDLRAGETKLKTWIAETGGVMLGAYFVEVRYVGPAKVEPSKPKEPSSQPPPSRPRRPSAYD